MRFAYVGFTDESGKRCFQFREGDAVGSVSLLTIEVEVSLLSKNKLPIQEAPLFCLRMLESAASSKEDWNEKFRHYAIVSDDFRTLNAERARREMEVSRRKHALRRRPSHSSLPKDLFDPSGKHAV